MKPNRPAEDFDGPDSAPEGAQQPRVAQRFRVSQLKVNMTGADVKRIRGRLGLRVIDLAEILCANDRTIRRIEHGDLPVFPHQARLLGLIYAIDNGADHTELLKLAGLPPRNERHYGPA